MKKIYGILLLTMLAICSATLISCSDDDDNNSPIVGTWNIGSGGITFYSSNTFTDNYFHSNATGTYSIEGNQITLQYNGGSTRTYTYSIKNSKLTLTDSDGIKYEFTKKESNNNKAIVGRWRMTYGGIILEEFTFKSNGSFIERYAEGINGKWEYDEDECGTYEIDDDLLILHYEDGCDDHWRFSVSKNKLILYGFLWGEGEAVEFIKQ